MTYIKQTMACSRCQFSIFDPSSTGGLCGTCHSKLHPDVYGDVIGTDMVIKQISDLKKKIKEKDKIIDSLRKDLSERPPKLQEGECPDCGFIGLHGCTGKRVDIFDTTQPTEFVFGNESKIKIKAKSRKLNDK